MKKSLFIMALGAIALTSCSQDEVLEVKKDAISFATITGNASRATTYNSTTNKVTKFKVTGLVTDATSTKAYFENLTLATAVSGVYDSGYYWPTGTMDFYAVAPEDYSITTGTLAAAASKVGDAAAKIKNVTIAADATSQADIVYALSTGKTKPAAATPVDLNFQHALAQVDFKVKIDASVKQALKVVVKSVTVKNLQGTGDYSLPSSTTDTDTDGKGSWAISGDLVDYKVTPATAFTINNGTGSTEVETDATESMLLLPQAIAASTYDSGWTAKGLFVLEADVYSMEGGNEVLLVSEDTYIPYAIDWAEGNKYTYTFVYTASGNGGKTDDNKDQLIPIQFTLSVDDFTPTSPAETPVSLQ